MKFTTAIRLLESGKEGKEWEVVLIQAGKSLNGRTYPADILRERVKLFDGAKACAYEFKGKFWNHLPETVRRIIPEGCIRNIVGWYSEPRFDKFTDENGATQEGIIAKLHIAENAVWLRQLLRDAWNYGKKNLLGLSIDGDGDVTPGGLVKDIRRIDEVTIVSNPAAGGQLVRLLAGLDPDEEVTQMEFLKRLYETIRLMDAKVIEGVDPEKITGEQELVLLKSLVAGGHFPRKEFLKEDYVLSQEALNRLIELLKSDAKDEAMKLLTDLQSKVKSTYPDGEPEESTGGTKKMDELKKQMEALEAKKQELETAVKEAKANSENFGNLMEELKKTQTEATLVKLLAESKLPEPIKDKIRGMFVGKIADQKGIAEAIKAETETWAKLAESGIVTNSGGSKAEVTLDEADKMQAHLDLLLDPAAEIDAKLKESVGTKSAFRGILAAYRAFHPSDPDVTFAFARESRMNRLKENITTGDFAYALGVSATKRAAKEYTKVEFPFAPIVTETSLDNFKQQEIIKWGGFSTLPTVSERGTYADLMEPTDERATYTPLKKGGLVYVTRETIKNDDMRYIMKIPTKVATASMRTLQRFVSALLTANGTYVPGGSAVFTAAYANYTTDALSYDHLTDWRNYMRQRRERGTSQLSFTATSAGSTTVVLSTASWTTNAYQNYYARVKYGTGAGQTRLISSNNGTTLTITPAWTTNPSTDSVVEVSNATNDDEKVGIKAEYIVHGDMTEAKVRSLLNSPKNPEDAASNEENVHYKSLTPIYDPYLEGSTYQYYTFLVAGKSQCDTIEIGYVDGKKTPQLFVQESPTEGRVLTNDEITYKVRFEFGGDVVDNIGLYGAFSTGV